MSTSRREFLRTATLGSAALAMAGRLSAETAPTVAPKGLARAPARPNLLFLWTDQHRGDTMPYAGNTVLQAPNLRRLGEQSFCFRHAYCAQPVCTPSRGSILTGLYPHHHGSVQNNIRLDPAKRTIAEYVAPDCATAYYGKWHLGDEIRAQHGFKEWRSVEDGAYRQFYTNKEDLKLRSSYHYHLAAAGFPPDENDTDSDGAPVFSRTMAAAMAERYTKVNFIADEAVRFIQARRDGQPFVLSVNSLEPHPPSYGPLNELHRPEDVPTGPAFAVPVGSGASKLHRHTYHVLHTKGYKNHPIDTPADFRRLRANYYGLIAMVDRAYGRVLRALEESGQADNTIVVYCSDHGDMMGDHGLLQKSVFYEGATHVPLMIHVPWLSRQQVMMDQPVNLVDLMPTMLDLLGAGVPAGIDGVSRAGALRDPASWRAEDLVIEWHEVDDHSMDGRSLRTADNWKLNLYHGDAPELYDLNTDPGELHNLGRDAAQSDRLRRLADRIFAWQKQHGDTMSLVV
ncbi:MAG TPA: sulfatase-like hydrolase/transferase [Lacunisphaera sp.]|nr:sulfatase-like hydrolase/transferase [Lacunisphaera sp.]